jgi:hypothetical protein
MKSQTFIFIHDQEILINYLNIGKFKSLPNLKFVFVGNGNTDKIENLENVIISKNLEGNIEQYPKFTSFTGWYSLWKNNLIDADYINLFEYDINLVSNFKEIQDEVFKKNFDFIGYIPFPMNNFHYVKNNDWIKDIIPAIKKHYSVDINSIVTKKLVLNPFEVWSSTSNSTFSKNSFNEYMTWFEKLIDDLKDGTTCGHAHERSISFYYLTHNKNVKIIPKVLTHFQLDSHKTQGHNPNLDDAMIKLTNNL